MPPSSLIDFEHLDLTRIAFDTAAIQRHCKQRGTFALLDGVLAFDRQGGSTTIGFKDLATDAWWTRDHIPERAIFPGVLQCEGAAQLASFDFLERRPEMAGKFLGFAGLDSVRFRGLVTPPARMLWAVREKKVRSSMFIYEAQGFVDRELVFEGEIIGAVV